MGQRFQVYVNYGKAEEPDKPGGNLFAMHLQWSWGPFSVIRAHQLVSFLDNAREYRFNPFGLGECSQVGGSSFDGRREDLYLLKALTEINLVSCSLVAGHDLMEEAPGYDKWRLEQDKLRRIPKTIEMDPLAQDNNDGFLVVQAAEHEVRYAFCKDASAIEPVSAAEYLKGYRDDLDRWEPQDRATVEAMVEDLDGYELLSKEDIEQIFQKHYDKKLNIEGYQEPERQPHRHEPLREVMGEAKDRAQTKQQPSKGKAHAPKRHDPER